MFARRVDNHIYRAITGNITVDVVAVFADAAGVPVESVDRALFEAHMSERILWEFANGWNAMDDDDLESLVAWLNSKPKGALDEPVVMIVRQFVELSLLVDSPVTYYMGLVGAGVADTFREVLGEQESQG